MIKTEYVNYKTDEKLDWDRIKGLKDNAMLKVRPELWCEWDFEKNDELGLDIWKITKGSKSEVWWIGRCGHEWFTSVATRNRRSKLTRCPYCYGNHKILKGFNDMWTTNPELAKLLANPEDGYIYSFGSKKKMIWICSKCNTVISNKSPSEVKRRGLKCPACSDGKSYSEKFICELLKQLDTIFENDTSFEWSNGKRYDFYISSLNCIIETHGEQHFTSNGFHSYGGRTLEEEKENDKYKRETALLNGIKSYIELDCRYSEFDHIKDSVMCSEIIKLFDLSIVDWEEIKKKSVKSNIHKVAELWNKGLAVKDITNECNVHRWTTTEYLKIANKIGLITYSPELSYKRANERKKSGY